MAKWNENYEPNIVTRKLEEIKRKKSSGNISFQGFEFQEYSVLINTIIMLDETIPKFEKRRIVDNAIFNVGQKDSITIDRLLPEISKLESRYLNQIPISYSLLTTISITRNTRIPKIKIDGCTITINPALSNKFIVEHNKIIEYSKKYFYNDLPDNYAFVKITLSSKSSFEAADKALDSINLIRAIWNYFYNRALWSRSSSGKRKPINKILLGPIHTLHKHNGEIASKNWWYDLDYIAQMDCYDPSRKLSDLNHFFYNFRKLLNKSKYYGDLKTALIRYTQSLDMINWENSFLRLWGILEHLTKNSNEKYDRTIKRVSFLYKEKEYTKQVLKHLKDYRNRSAHADSSNDDIEVYLFQLKRYVEALIEFHLKEYQNFNSLNDATEFMDLPYDINVINKKLKLLKKAKIFQDH